MSGSSSYLGSADPGTSLTDFSMLRFIAQQAIEQLSTATVVQVVRAPYDRDGNAITPGSAVPVGFIDVQPLVNQLDGAGNAVPHETVYRLSYHRYQGGNGAFISDPVVGDQGKMIVADRDTSTVRNTNKQGNPGSGRVMDKADGTYFGVTQGATSPSQYLAWLAQGFKLVDSFGNTIQGTSGGVVINGATITLSGDVVTKHGTSLDHHVNTNVTTGTDNTGPPP